MGASDTNQQAAPPASSERPIPLVARSDLHINTVEFHGQTYWIVKDPVNLEYFRLNLEQQTVLSLLDGKRNIESLCAAFASRFPTRRLTSLQIRKLVVDLYDKGLVWSTRSGQGDSLAERRAIRRKRRYLAAIRNLFFIRLPGWDPQQLIDRGYPLVKWLFHPWAAVAAMVFILAAWGLLLFRFEEAQERLGTFNPLASWQSIAGLWIVLGISKLIHELGHGFACRHFGGECHEIGVAFLVFSPCLYCDVSDSWLLPSRRKRIIIGAAGMYVEMILSVAALFICWNTRPGWIHDLSFALFLVTHVTTIAFNLNPLLRLDGYYILSDWLQIPNLRQRADQALQRFLARCCLGIRLANDLFSSESGGVWFVLYAVASAVYRWLILFAVCIFLFHWLAPYGLEHLGLLLGLAAVCLALGSALKRVITLVITHRDQVTTWIRPAATLLAASALLVAMLLVPLPRHVEAPLVIEPRGLRHVYVTTPGHVDVVYVRPGMRVKKGDRLVQLTDLHRVEHLRRLRLAQDLQQIEVKIQQAVGHAAHRAQAQKTLEAIRREVAEYERQLSRLRVVAPCDGVVVFPPPRKESHRALARQDLPQWRKTPLDVQNRGAYLHPATLLLSIAPDAEFQGVLTIDELDRHDFTMGQEVKVKMDHVPGVAVKTSIDRIARRATASPRSVSGPTDFESGQRSESGRDHPYGKRYAATVRLPSNGPTWITGMQGRARVLVSHRSAANWLWRSVRATLRLLT